jgi:hypothetical protein
LNRRITVLQTAALPLGYAAVKTEFHHRAQREHKGLFCQKAKRKIRMYDEKMERETGFEPATSTLARLHSTTELFPPEQQT